MSNSPGWVAIARSFARRHPVGVVVTALASFVTFLGGIADVTGFNLRDLSDRWSSLAPATLSDKTRSALRSRLRPLAADGALSVDESQELRDYVASLGLEIQPAEQYLSELEPRMLQAARDLQVGAQLAAQERFPEARARFREATRLDSESATAWANLGGAALELGVTTEAEAALRKALALEPQSIEANYNLGACLAAQKRGSAALDHLERSMTLLLHGDASPVFSRQALLDDLQTSDHFSALRGSDRFDALIRRIYADFR
jgi:tetratricopeptide (TPR) repeat protein